MVYVRSAQSELLTWYQSKGRKPLIIRGARQVGKSTLVRQFAQDSGLKLVEINLEKHTGLNASFATLNVGRVLSELSVIAGMDLTAASQTVLFLDEIQATPRALQWLRYIYEERPSQAVIAAGSLLEFAIKDADFSMPVGRVDYLWLRPMSFFEYLGACQQHHLATLIAAVTPKTLEDFPRAAHAELLVKQREYLVVGGMPAVVTAYLDEGPIAARRVQEAILASYLDDLAKYSRRHPLARLQRVFGTIPGVLGTRVKYAHLSRHDQNRDIKDVLDLLTMAGVILPIYHSDCSGIPLAAGEDTAALKLLFLDVGLACRALGLDWSEQLHLEGVRLINDGALAEQFVGQELAAVGSPREATHLHFWRRDKAQSEAEIDYVIALSRNIVPIEVKAGASGTLRSLHQFVLAKSPRLALRFDSSPPSQFMINHSVPGPDAQRTVEYPLLSLPLYFASQGPRLAKELLSELK